MPACDLREGQDYLLFKKGISPDWSDPLNMQGGRLIVNMRREEGGQFREEVCFSKENNLLASLKVFLCWLLLKTSGKIDFCTGFNTGVGSQRAVGDYVGGTAPAAYWRAGTASSFNRGSSVLADL